jgi:hypothetical protein
MPKFDASGRRTSPFRQSPVRGGRVPVSSAFLDAVEAAVAREMRRFNVSRSFVIATAVAYALKVEEQADYRQAGVPESKRRKQKPQVLDFLPRRRRA